MLDELKKLLQNIFFDERKFAHLSPFSLLYYPDYQICVHVITFDIYSSLQLDSSFFQHLSIHFQQQDIHLVQLWEDVWQTKKEIATDRILSFFQENRIIHASSTTINIAAELESKIFIDNHHLFGYTKSNLHLGLFYKGILVTCAIFSQPRYMKNETPEFYSTELLRYVGMKGINVNGGLSKITQGFFQQSLSDEIMTYVDMDWSGGTSYTALGYQLKAITDPITFWIHPSKLLRFKINRFPTNILANNLSEEAKEETLTKMGYLKIYNSGNFKLVLKKRRKES